jgi:hypothetical protein
MFFITGGGEPVVGLEVFFQDMDGSEEQEFPPPSFGTVVTEERLLSLCEEDFTDA